MLNFFLLYSNATVRIVIPCHRHCHSRRLSSLDGDDRESPYLVFPHLMGNLLLVAFIYQ